MKYILIIICSIFLSTYSLQQTKPKLCINCKFFITDNERNEYGKCSLFPKKQNDNINFLVNGINKDTPIDYYYASTIRNFESCGKEGRLYKRKFFDFKNKKSSNYGIEIDKKYDI